VSSQLQALGLLGCEGAEADALHLAGDFELDLRGRRVRLSVKRVVIGSEDGRTHSLRHSEGGCCELAHTRVPLRSYRTVQVRAVCVLSSMYLRLPCGLESDRRVCLTSSAAAHA
jgi:hypothetical protein